mgnify:FL=1
MIIDTLFLMLVVKCTSAIKTQYYNPRPAGSYHSDRRQLEPKRTTYESIFIGQPSADRMLAERPKSSVEFSGAREETIDIEDGYGNGNSYDIDNGYGYDYKTTTTAPPTTTRRVTSTRRRFATTRFTCAGYRMECVEGEGDYPLRCRYVGSLPSASRGSTSTRGSTVSRRSRGSSERSAPRRTATESRISRASNEEDFWWAKAKNPFSN